MSMFDLSAKPCVWIPVYWPGLAASEEEDGLARMIEHRIDVQVELLDREELKEWFLFDLDDNGHIIDDNGNPKIKDGEPVLPPKDIDVFLHVVKNWRRVKSGDQTVPFSAEKAAIILGQPSFPTAFGTAYLKAVAGKIETREKNSEGSPPAGRAGDR